MRAFTEREKLLAVMKEALKSNFLITRSRILQLAGVSGGIINRYFGTMENLRAKAFEELKKDITPRGGTIEPDQIDLCSLIPPKSPIPRLHVEVVGDRIFLWAPRPSKRGGQSYGISLRRFVNRSIFIAGLCIFAGEGTKRSIRKVELVNSSAAILRVFIRFLNELGVPMSRLTARIQIHEGQDVRKIERYWSRQTGITLQNFRTPIIKKASSRSPRRDHDGKGCLTIRFGSKVLYSFLSKWTDDLDRVLEELR